MNSFVCRKLAEVGGTLLILFPCIFLLAWEERIVNPGVYWGVLLICCATFGSALMISENRQGKLTLRRVIGKFGGYVFMFICILIKFISFLK